MSTTQQPEALNLEEFRAKVTHAAREPLLARIAELEAQLSAIGAGGVEPLRKQASTADVADERDAFDKWLRIKPYGAAHDFGWQAWKARAALASTPVAGELAMLQAGLQAAAPNAPLYDPREVAFSAQAAPQAVQAAVPVAGQSRFKGEKDWHWCSPEHVAMVAATPSEWQGYEARYLYAHAAPAHPAEGVPAQAAALLATGGQAQAVAMLATGLPELTEEALSEKIRSHGAYGGLAAHLIPFIAQHATPQMQADALDAARYRWLRNQMLGVDFDWCGNGITALVFEVPDGCAYSSNCDQNIDAAVAAQAKQGEKK